MMDKIKQTTVNENVYDVGSNLYAIDTTDEHYCRIFNVNVVDVVITLSKEGKKIEYWLEGPMKNEFWDNPIISEHVSHDLGYLQKKLLEIWDIK
jgi:hypothetical protein